MNKSINYRVLTIIFIACSIYFLPSCTRKSPKQRILIAQSYLRQGLVEVQHRQYKKAINLINRSLDCHKTIEALALKATLLYQIGLFTESIALFENLINDTTVSLPLKADILNNYACVLSNSNKRDDAEKIWRALIHNEHYLTHEVAWYNIGRLKYDMHDFAQARIYFDHAVHISPDYIDALWYSALCSYALKEYSLARKRVFTIIEFAPNHRAAHELLEQLSRQSPYVNLQQQSPDTLP